MRTSRSYRTLIRETAPTKKFDPWRFKKLASSSGEVSPALTVIHPGILRDCSSPVRLIKDMASPKEPIKSFGLSPLHPRIWRLLAVILITSGKLRDPIWLWFVRLDEFNRT